jgi:signal transduction histidine kinase
MSARPQDTPLALARAATRDPFVRVLGALMVVEIAAYVAPGVPKRVLALFGQYYYQLPFLGILFLGSVAGIARLAGEERRFWTDVSAGIGCWLAATVVAATTTLPSQGRSASLVVDAPYALGYLFLILAIGRRPQLGAARPLAFDGRIRTIGLAAIGVGWYVYFVLMPNPTGAEGLPTVAQAEYCYVALGVVLIVVTARSWLTCRNRRWTVILGALTVAFLLTSAGDAVDLLLESGVLSWENGQPTDLLWAVPSAALLLAVRLRHAPALAEDTSRSPGGVAIRDVRPVATAAGLLAGAFSFPLVHMWTYGWSRLRVAEPRNSVLVFSELLLLTTLAIVGYVALDRRRRVLAEARREFEERLRRSEHMEAIGRLAGVIAHDLNNLLTAVQGYKEMALEDLDPDHEARALLEQVGRAAERAVTVARQLLAFSRQQALSPAPLDVNDVVRQVSEILTRLIGEDVMLQVALAPGPLIVMADRHQLEAALVGLALNARDAMPQGGTLAISTAAVMGGPEDESGQAPPGPTVELTVRDSGAALDPAVLSRVFEPFYSAAARGAGTGLGLAAVYGIVTQSGGTITATSQPGVGSAFVVRLPARG